MNFLKGLFGKSDEAEGDRAYDDFWTWFLKQEKAFAQVLRDRDDVEDKFMKPVAARLKTVREGLYVLVGVMNDVVDLTISADGNVKMIVFAEELVSAAPEIDGWRISALKPPEPMETLRLEMRDLVFDVHRISFYSNDTIGYPDLVDITIVHQDLNAENEPVIESGVYVFLEHLLGELEFVEAVDKLQVIGPAAAERERVSISKLKDFLAWRKEEFVEKYDSARYNTETDGYAALNGRLPDGTPLIATVNDTLLEWDRKASHPWILRVSVAYNSSTGQNMPDKATYALLDNLEEDINAELKDEDGYLNVGRQTGGGVREVYFACRDFRKPSKVLDKLTGVYADRFKISYDLYRDKYWRSFERFRVGH